jgi:hypothetical protein
MPHKLKMGQLARSHSVPPEIPPALCPQDHTGIHHEMPKERQEPDS